MTDFRLKQNGLRVASVSCPARADAVREILHYAAVYGQDGPVEIYERLGRTFRRVMLNEVRP